ncbi:MAG: 30S ribosomal protein S12 methylthiotransferase RimO [Flavobacteriales bacterium]|nr:MAG: 30S ribosomal protein S12 methylthiotransferase RimO [Flavobacteriales bacterium]
MKTKENGRKQPAVNIITLGCSKNLYDSETLAGQLEKQGREVSHEGHGNIVVVNTCGFIGDAKEQSVNAILEQVERKRRGEIDRLYVSGCLSQRYMDELRGELPEVDGFYGVNDMKAILAVLGADYKKELAGERLLSTPRHYAYLKISEGCDRACSYCAIPLIRGKHISRPVEELIEEARILASKGVKELILIAQDLTYYGMDLYGRRRLADLVRGIAEVDGIEWIRLHYAYPNGFPEDVLEVMASEPKVCKYLDIPLQHISDRILKSMKRGSTKEQINALLDKIREKVPGVALRTTLIVGYPGETPEEFEELKAWVQGQRFDRMGCFAYSEEEGTSAAQLEDDVPDEEKQRRVEELMEVQREISLQKNEEKVGKTLRVLIDTEQPDVYIGRTEYDSPEVDNDVFIDREKYRVPTGGFVKVEVTSAGVYDLFGIPVP